MFGKSSPKPQPQEQIDLQDINSSLKASLSKENREEQNTVLQTESDLAKSELVNTVEKISRIVSPYFIVVVGLSLSEKNFLLGTILIILGILSLLKVSTEDVAKFVNWLKSFLGVSNS
jgi:hypothetical protein